MPSLIEQLRFFAVIVNEGSGCIYQPLDSKYTYILTAAHNIPANTVTVKRPGKQGEVFNVLKILKYKGEEPDVAIVLIPRIEMNEFDLYCSEPKEKNQLILYGFPERLGGGADDVACTCGYTTPDKKTFEISTNTIQFTLTRDTPASSIGFSGSGVFADHNGQLALTGILYELKDNEGGNSKLLVHHLSCFNQLLLDEVLPVLFDTDNVMNPYRGINRFVTTDAKFYFGREEQIRMLFGLLQTNRVAAIFGDSGSGKSSLVRAGFFKGLNNYKKEFANPFFVEYDVSLNPIPGLCQALQNAAHNDGKHLVAAEVYLHQFASDATKEKQIPSSKDTSQKLVNDLVSTYKDRKIVVVLDQFERLFSHYEQNMAEPQAGNGEEGKQETIPEQFSCLIEEMINAGVHVILVSRTEYLKQVTSLAAIAKNVAGSQFTIVPMDADALREVIEEPAFLQNRRVEERLISELVSSTVNRRNALVLLELALEKLWQEDHLSGVLKFETFKKISEYNDITSNETFSGIKGILVRKAEDVYNDILSTDDERKKVPVIFISLIKDYKEKTRFSPAVISTGRAFRNEFDDTTWEVAKKLSDSFLLNTGFDEVMKQESIEIGHEQLFSHWPRLKNWLDKDFNDVLKWLQEDFNPDYEQYKNRNTRKNYLTAAAAKQGKAYANTYPVLFQNKKMEFLKNSHRYRRNWKLAWIGIAAIIIAGIVKFIQLTQNQKAGKESADLLLSGTKAMAEKDYYQASLDFRKADSLSKNPEAREKLFQCRLLMHAPGSARKLNDSVITLSDNGQYALVYKEGRAVVWNTAENFAAVTLVNLEGQIAGAVFSPDNSRLAVSLDSSLVVYKLGNEDPEVTIPHVYSASTMSFSPDKRWLAYAPDAYAVYLYDFERKLPVPLSEELDDALIAMEFSRNSDRLIMSTNEVILNWEKKGSKWAQKNSFSTGIAINCIAVDIEGTGLAIGRDDGSVGIYDLDNGTLVNNTPVSDDYIAAIQFSPSNRYIMTISGDEKVNLWTREPLAQYEILNQKNKLPSHIAFGNTDDTIRVVYADSTIQTWLADNTFQQVTADTNYIYSIEPHPNNKWVALGQSGTAKSNIRQTVLVKILGIKNNFNPKLLSVPGDRIRLLTASRTGNYLAACTSTGNGYSVVVWETNTWSQVRSINLTNRPGTFWFDQSDRLYISESVARQTKLLSIYELPGKKNPAVIDFGDNYIARPSEFNPQKIFTKPEGDTILYLRNADKKGMVDTFRDASGDYLFYENYKGEVLTSEEGNKVLNIHDFKTKRFLFSLDRYKNYDPKFCMANSWVMYTGTNDSLKLFNYETKKAISFRNPAGFIKSMEFSRDGKKIYLLTSDHAVFIYHFDEIIKFLN